VCGLISSRGREHGHQTDSVRPDRGQNNLQDVVVIVAVGRPLGNCHLPCCRAGFVRFPVGFRAMGGEYRLCRAQLALGDGHDTADHGLFLLLLALSHHPRHLNWQEVDGPVSMELYLSSHAALVAAGRRQA